MEKVGQPVLLLALALFYFLDGKVESVFQRLDQVFVAVAGVQPVGKDLPHGVSAGTDFTADGDDERFVQVHKLCGVLCKGIFFFLYFKLKTLFVW